MKRILVLAHREELIFQAAAHARNAGLTAGIEMGNHRAGKEDVVVSTVQTQNASRKCIACIGESCAKCGGRGKVKRMERFNPFDFGLVVVDEGHHATAKTYRIVLEWFKQNPDLKILLVTATPKRADGDGLHNVCDSVAYEMDLRTAIDEGWLCPIRQMFVTVESLDLSKVKTKAGGDLADGELERAFLGDTDEEEERLLHEICYPCLKEADGEPVLVFASGVNHAEKLTAAFNAYDGVTAEMVIGTTDKNERPRIIQRYKNGDTQVLVGCGCFTEGFDAPNTSVVAIARPTKSESLYLQMIGRGTRPTPGTVDGPETAAGRREAIAGSSKPFCTIIDYVGNSGRHKLVSVADVLAGADVDPIDLEAALAEAKDVSEPVDMEELLEKARQAREEKEQREEEERLRREERKKRVTTAHKADSGQYTTEDVDLFNAKTFDAFTDYEPSGPAMASQKQVNLLVKLGVKPETAVSFRKTQAGAVIDKLTSQTGPDYIMRFGKHAGKKLSDVPRGYINWAMEHISNPDLQKNIDLLLWPQKATQEVPF